MQVVREPNAGWAWELDIGRVRLSESWELKRESEVSVPQGLR